MSFFFKFFYCPRYSIPEGLNTNNKSFDSGQLISVSSGGVIKLPLKQTQLKRWIATEMRWNRWLPSRGSPVTEEMRRPRSHKKEMALLLKGPRVSQAIGMKRYELINSEYFSSPSGLQHSPQHCPAAGMWWEDGMQQACLQP